MMLSPAASHSAVMSQRLLAVLLLTGCILSPGKTMAQPGPAAANPTPLSETQLDRIESKLDDLLRRLPPAAPASPSTAERPPAPPNVATPGEADRPGSLALARPVGRDERTLGDVPQDSVGGFVYSGGPLPFSDPASRAIRYNGLVGYELQGWLKVAEEGRYQLGTEVTARFAVGAFVPPTCVFAAWLENRRVGEERKAVPAQSGRSSSATLVFGGDLSPGLYRLRVWVACLPQPNVATSAELLLKPPSELNLRPTKPDELAHREGSRSMSQ